MVLIKTFTVSLFHVGCECPVTGFDAPLPFMDEEVALREARRMVAAHYEPDIIVRKVVAT